MKHSKTISKKERNKLWFIYVNFFKKGSKKSFEKFCEKNIKWRHILLNVNKINDVMIESLILKK